MKRVSMAGLMCGMGEPRSTYSVSSFLQTTGILKTASCQSMTHGGYIKRASTGELKEIFDKYASLTVEGDKFMTDEDFVIRYLGLLPEKDYNKESLHLLCGVLDQSKEGRISFKEFQTFEGNLCVPDALYKTAFQLFDTNGNGSVSFDEFVDIISKTTIHKRIPFNYDSEFIKLYFGKEKSRQISYSEFSQFLHDFHDEYATVAFKAKDKNGTGFISAKDFEDIMVSIKSHLLTDSVKSNLAAVASADGNQVSYPYFIAFISLLSNMELIKKVYLNASNGSRMAEIKKEDFLYSAQMMSQITPLEVDVLFQICDKLHGFQKIMYEDFAAIAPEQYMKQVQLQYSTVQQLHSVLELSQVLVLELMSPVIRFALGSFAGACGATAVYPIDLVKTRMQNQRTGSYIGELMYRNSFDCFKKVLRHEGFTGLYRGLVPQLMGVAPEKAIKLTMNDFARDKLKTANGGHLPLWAECLAGACGGGSQVMFTNPLEIVKIRLQVAGELAAGSKVSAMGVVRELGFFGLYKGSRACFLRDIPFSAIYFPAYAHLKPAFADENGYNSPLSLLTAGAIAGMPAASLVTPADVIKTRLQVVARAGQTTYTGVMDAARKIYAEEGFRAFWKGSIARMCRSSPQFGVTLVTYELMQRYFYIDFGGSRPSGSVSEGVASAMDMSSGNPEHIGGYQVARPIFAGVESKFGLLLPRFSHS
ncbi:calcium-binding mitochondrial carrier protein Aralar1 [Eurytemora carolleeae]|uniref:calcium-binding mitochondrial carrier protein Aralar1 n=1 Tax=Eurytemora carolleeae TaxID=1294199 RepID=UPI000C78474D|nr:calcium-binding mitochondrial carrier protein Aralar1 [Eurytemora carolleeae]|eukprot:XP_023349419.1 calcium-binding mitochondrial carrier protein Aralar1-like [Eurytemora affinis]